MEMDISEKFVLDARVVQTILERGVQKAAAEIFEASTQSPVSIREITLTLDSAKSEGRPYEIQFPFKSVYVRDATDSNTNVRLKLDTRDDSQDMFTLKLGETYAWDKVRSRAFIHWDAQASKSITIIFGVDVEVRGGKTVSVNSGGVSINDGSAAASSRVATTASTAGALLAQNLNRKVATVFNDTGGVLYLGGSSSVTGSGANKGIPLNVGESVEWRNTAALYAYADATGYALILEET